VHEDDDPRLKQHRYQGLPVEGYAALMRNMLRGVPVISDCDYLQNRGDFAHRKQLVFTGPIDEFFRFELGRLTYRCQHREHEWIPNVKFAQPSCQVNNPAPDGRHIRTLEWKHMMATELQQGISGTLITRETAQFPSKPDEYEYPFPDRANAQLYQKYLQRARNTPGLLICGRLGEYRYYDMDQAIARAMTLADGMLGRSPAREESHSTKSDAASA
jgi:UDP-galactopyranose mutase